MDAERILSPQTDFNGGIGIAEMIGRANYVALVGGGERPKFPQTKVGLTLNSARARARAALTFVG
jgi:hypothetical protein